MKALVVSAFWADIGSSKQGYIINVLDSVKALLELGLDVTVLAFGNSEPDIPNVKRELIPIKGPRVSIEALRRRYELYKRFRKLKYEILYVHHSPDFPSVLFLRRKTRLRILHLHDILSDVAFGIYGPLGVPLSLVYFIDESLSSRYTDLAIVPSESMGEIIKEKGYKDVDVAYNRPGPVEPKETELAERIKSYKRPVFVYIGTIQQRIRGLEEILKVVKDKNGTLVAIGKKESPLPKEIKYEPPVPRDELIGAIRYADFGVLGKTIRYALPAKIFDYMYAGLPILTSKHNEAILKLLNKYRRPYVLYDTGKELDLSVDRPKIFPKEIKARKDMIKEAVQRRLDLFIRIKQGYIV